MTDTNLDALACEYCKLNEFKKKDIYDYSIAYNSFKAGYLAHQADAECLVKALEFYSSNWRSDVYVGPTKEMLDDFGKTARAALAEYRLGEK